MDSEHGWVADGSIGWRILLTAELGSGSSGPAALRRGAQHDDLAALQRRLTRPDERRVVVVETADHVVISAHHASVDGLGLLELLDRAGHGPARSSARGVGDAPTGALASGIRDRLGEALRRPPALPVPPVHTRLPGDALVAGEVAGPRRTAEIVYAAAQAVQDWQSARGASADHVAIAVGASRGARPPGAEPADDSVLLRLRDVERLDREEIVAALRATTPEPRAATGSRVTGLLLGVGLHVLRPRLGSTLLVSHLGEVTAPNVERLTFHPVTAGGSGISLGAVGHAGRTTLTLRARASRWDDNGLEQLLEAIIQRL